MALKIDVRKTYDRVDKGYLATIMAKMGFSHKWIQWMTMGLTSMVSSIMVNGEEVGLVILGRCLLRARKKQEG